MSMSIKKFSSVLGAAALAISLMPTAEPARAAEATFTVNSYADGVDAAPGDGVCATTSGHCTLRAAIQEVNKLGGGPHTIILDKTGTYTLSIANLNLDRNNDGVQDDESEISSGDLDVVPPVAGGSVAVTIKGKGISRDDTVINGNGTVINDRVFDIHPGASVTLYNASIRNGAAPGTSGGGARNRGTLKVEKVALSGNRASNGGGIRSSGSGSLTVVNTRIYDNVANEGGGIRVTNTAQISGGTEIYRNQAGSATVQGFGGGIDVDSSARVTISGGTKIYENASSYKGGGIDNDGALSIKDSRITSNKAGVPGGGGGIENSTPVTLTNTIVANNTFENCSPNPCQ